eukprot:scaffold49490_cov91-Phaeocystis_antarctica.AAC.2
MENTLMMTPDYFGDEEAMAYAQRLRSRCTPWPAAPGWRQHPERGAGVGTVRGVRCAQGSGAASEAPDEETVRGAPCWRSRSERVLRRGILRRGAAPSLLG